MATIVHHTSTVANTTATATTTTPTSTSTVVVVSDFNGNNQTAGDDDNDMTIKERHIDDEANNDPITAYEALRQQNDALRQELHDIRREMDEITDQFRTEDAEEFKQVQAELEVAAKNCRILQFKLRKSEKRNENIEAEKGVLEEKIHLLARDGQRIRDIDEELLVAKEVSVRLHSELEKSEESRMTTEKLNMALKQHLDSLKECLDQKLSSDTNDDYLSWQLSAYLYESLFREYVLMEELTWLNSNNFNNLKNSTNHNHDSIPSNDINDLLGSYQQKIALLHDDIDGLKQDLIDRDKEIEQVRIQNKILKQRSRSVDRATTNGTSSHGLADDGGNNNRSRRGVSVDGGGHLREQLDTSLDEIKLLKNKLLRLEDELNNSVVEKETLLAKLDQQAKEGVGYTLSEDLHTFANKIDDFNTNLKAAQIDSRMIVDLQQIVRSCRWNKATDEEQAQFQSNVNQIIQQTSGINQPASDLLNLLQNKHDSLDKIRYRLSNICYDTNDTCTLLEELDTIKRDVEEKQQTCDQLQISVNILQISSKKLEEQLQQQVLATRIVEKSLEQQKILSDEMQQENMRLSTLTAKQTQDLRHFEQLRQSIVIFEKKLDQKQTRVNELSMKIIEKEDIIETKVKECQKHRMELRELESKYYTLGKQLEEQIISMTKEMEKLNIEKEMLRFDLESIRLNQQQDHRSMSAAKSTSEDDEIARVKAECRQQMIDGEIETYKLRINQLTNEKDDLLKNIKDIEKKYKEVQIKYDADDQSWARTRKDMAEKQRKHEESIKMKSELQNAVDRLRQKLYDLEVHAQEKQNKYALDKQLWETHRIEATGKINELEEQLSKVTKRQRKDLETAWKKERNDLQKQLQQSQQLAKDLQKQITTREAPVHLTEKINVLMTENELLLNKIKELEIVVDDVQLLKSEMHRLRDKNSSDWNYWRKQQSDLYAQLRQQQLVKESILNKFDRLQKQIKSAEGGRLIRDISVGPLSINSFQNDSTTKTSLSNYSRETLADDIELPHGTIDGRGASANEIVGTIDDSARSPVSISDDAKQKMFNKTYSAQENTAASLEEIASKIDRVEDNLFSYRRFMDFIRAKSEKSGSVVRDDSFSNIVNHSNIHTPAQRLASAPPENLAIITSSSSSSAGPTRRRSRFDANANSSHENLPSSISPNDSINNSDLMSNSVSASSAAMGSGSSKNRFFSLSRRFRFRTASPEKTTTIPAPATVHFLDEDIDLETKERTTRRSEQHGHRPSKGILKTLRHRSPFRFRSKDAVIVEQEPSPPPPPTPVQLPAPSATKDNRQKVPPSAPTHSKHKGRLVELKKTTSKSSSSNGARKAVTVTPVAEPSGSTLMRRTSGLKDLIHKFEATPSDQPAKSKRVTIDINVVNPSGESSNSDEHVTKSVSYSDLPQDDKQQRAPSLATNNKSKTIDIPDLLRNVEKEPTQSKPVLRHSNSSRQTTSFDSTTSMVSASESTATTNSTRRPTSTARPLMLSVNKEEPS